MKLVDIAIKDVWHSLRNAFFLVFGLGLPLLTAALFYFAFGGLASGDEGFELPTTRVVVVNLDEARMGFSAGGMLAGVLQEALPGVIETTEAPDAASARTAVDRQEAAVAVIIPAGFTAAVFEAEGQAAIELYQDPTLSLGPGIVKGIVSQLVDGFSGSKIATETAQAQLAERGVTADEATLQEIATGYGQWSAGMGAGFQEGENPLYEAQAPTGVEEQEGSEMGSILGLIMAGMMVFYVFFSGAASAESILREDEEGTLPRLFTTPTPQSAILGGKFVATFATLAVQVTVLLLASRLVFRIDWGEPLPVALATVGTVVLASSFGIFITSMLKDRRQSGIIFGGVMTVLGMIGMVSVFTAGVPNTSDAIQTASLISPHGWAVRGWRLLLEGGGTSDVLLTVVVMLLGGAAFFAIGVLKFRKRFA